MTIFVSLWENVYVGVMLMIHDRSALLILRRSFTSLVSLRVEQPLSSWNTLVYSLSWVEPKTLKLILHVHLWGAPHKMVRTKHTSILVVAKDCLYNGTRWTIISVGWTNIKMTGKKYISCIIRTNTAVEISWSTKLLIIAKCRQNIDII